MQAFDPDSSVLSRYLDADFSDIRSRLLKRRWKLYSSSPLFRAHPDNAKSHIRALTKEINGSWKRGKRLTYTVRLEYCPNIQLTENGPDPLKVEVTSSESKSLYIGYFLNLSATNFEEEGFRKLPLLLVAGNRSMSQIVNKALAKVFDCNIRNMSLNEGRLVTLFCVLLKFSDSQDMRLAKLKYHVPGIPRMSTITASIRVKDAGIVFEFYTRPELGPPVDIQYDFYEKIKAHFRHTYSLDFSYGALSAVSLPIGSVDGTGQIILYGEKTVVPLLIAIQNFIGNEVPAAPASVITSIFS